jgi:hypothetical protein
MLQQRYYSDQGWIIIHQEKTDPAAGEPVFLEDGTPAPDGKYQFNTPEQDRYIEVREGMVHFYYHHRKETDIGTSNVFILVVLFVVLLFIIFRVMGRR